jgi:threonine dehydratase
VLTSEHIDEIAGAHLFFKCENFQKTGAFKYRGASNAVLSLDNDTAMSGVATHSSGNHGAALAKAALQRGIAAHIVMPENASRVKFAAVRHYQGIVHVCKSTLQAREECLAALVKETGCTFVPPFDHAHIIAGQGTAAMEALQQVAEPDVIITPVGGGGLLAGTAIVSKDKNPQLRVLGGEPSGADDAFRSLQTGERILSQVPRTIADGLLTTLGDLNYDIIKSLVDGILVVDDAAIIEAMRLVWSRMKIVIEPSSAVPLAAVLQNKQSFIGQRVLIILTGGNVDLDRLPW